MGVYNVLALVEHDTVQDVFVVFAFEGVAHLIDFVVQVRGLCQQRDEVANEKCSGDGVFVVVLDVHVDYMHGDIAGAVAVLQKFDDLIVDSFLASDQHVELFAAGLKSLGGHLDPPIPVQHV